MIELTYRTSSAVSKAISFTLSWHVIDENLGQGTIQFDSVLFWGVKPVCGILQVALPIMCLQLAFKLALVWPVWNVWPTFWRLGFWSGSLAAKIQLVGTRLMQDHYFCCINVCLLSGRLLVCQPRVSWALFTALRKTNLKIVFTPWRTPGSVNVINFILCLLGQ